MVDPVPAQVASATPMDGNANPVFAITPGNWGDIKTFTLTIPAGSSVKMTEAADASGPNSFYTGRPMELQMWLLQNFDLSQHYFISGDDAADGHGVILPEADDATHPGSLALKTDPDKTYIHNPSSGAGELKLTLIGRYLRA